LLLEGRTEEVGGRWCWNVLEVMTNYSRAKVQVVQKGDLGEGAKSDLYRNPLLKVRLLETKRPQYYVSDKFLSREV